MGAPIRCKPGRNTPKGRVKPGRLHPTPEALPPRNWVPGGEGMEGKKEEEEAKKKKEEMKMQAIAQY